jgi:hypothetical protein
MRILEVLGDARSPVCTTRESMFGDIPQGVGPYPWHGARAERHL